MTFREFVASRQHTDDVLAAIGTPETNGDGPATPGYVYGETPCWYICDPCPQTGGDYWTELGNQEPQGPLHEVERRLYLFAAGCSPDWVDHDFVVVYPVFNDLDTRETSSLVGVIECVIDEGVRPRRVSDSLPPWICDWFLGDRSNIKRSANLDNWSHPVEPWYMV
jgi:hypothetical protein